MKRFVFDIDVVGACNLRCPSCPQGNDREHRLAHGEMEPELLERIVAKALSESKVRRINLFSWGEPLLHKRIHELIRVVQERGIGCGMSSNLNILPDADAVMAANPAEFKISVSGFTQKVYGLTHRGGDVERVKRHMAALAAAKKRQGASTRVFVNYHRYRHNLTEEGAMRGLAEELGFEFEPSWALMLPLEKVLASLGEEAAGVAFGDDERRLAGRLALPPDEALKGWTASEDRFCQLREEQVSLDFRGNVQLCCGVFDTARFTLGPYLDLPLPTMQQLRREHPMCRVCTDRGAHRYLTYRTPGMKELILDRVAPRDAELLGLEKEMGREPFLRRLRQLCPPALSRLVAQARRNDLKARLKGLAGKGSR